MGAGGFIGLGVLAFLALMAATWLVQGSNFFMYKVFAPKYEEVRRQRLRACSTLSRM